MGFKPPNQDFRGNNRGHSSQPSGGTPPSTSMPVRGSNAANRFDVGSIGRRPQNPAVTAPGHGMILVNPFMDSGRPAIGARIPDDADLKIPRDR
jgi:hypothetical protein